MKIQTGSTFIGKSKDDEQYEDKLKKETIEECIEFSKLYFKAFNQLSKVTEGRNAIKTESEKIKALEQGNENNLLKYLEHLILDNHNYEFIVPYYLVSNDIQHHIEANIAVHENHHFGVLGDVHEILS